MAFLDMFKKNVGSKPAGVSSNVNQSALNLIMDQIKDLIEINTSLNKKYRDLESKLSTVNADVGSDKKSVQELQKKLGDLQSNMEKFIGLYEVITNQFNPFVDTGQETDDYEIDSSGNPVPFKRPSYGGSFNSRIPGAQMMQVSPEMGDGGVIAAHPIDGMENMSRENKITENPAGNPGLTNIDTKTGDTLALEKEPKMQEIIKSEEGGSFTYDNSSSLDTRNSSVLEKLDINAIVPLSSISGNVNSITTVLSWMVYLSKQCGENASEVLNYYTNIGWISQNVCNVLTSYLSGIHVKPDDDSDAKMDVSDHIVSLFFIAKIKGVNVNAKTYRLISKIVKSKGFIIDE